MANIINDRNEYLRRITNLKNEKNYTEAAKIALEAFQNFRDNCFLNEIYICYIGLNKRHEAIKVLKEILKINPYDITALKRLGYNYYCLGDYKQSLKYFQATVNFEPLSSNNHFNLACIYHFLKNYKLAEINYSAAIKLNKKNISALNNKGILHYELGEWEKAIPYFQYAIKNSKNHPEAYFHMGIIFRDYYKDYELSELYLKKAIELDPKYSENYYQIALTYQKRNKTADYILALKQCVNINPKHKAAVNLLKNL